MIIEIVINGGKFYYKNIKRFCENNTYGAAIVNGNYKAYCIDNELHNTLGPAQIWGYPRRKKKYWFHNNRYAYEDWIKKIADDKNS